MPASEPPVAVAPSAPETHASGTPAESRARTLGAYHGALLLAWLIVAAATLAFGFDYYLTPLAERAYAPRHELLKPSGLIGQGYGVVGTLFIVLGVGSYALRKRSLRGVGLGKLKHWLEAHIFLCTLGPFLIVLHTSFKFGGLVAVAFWSMLLVVASGVFGRYVYVRIPKGINGRFRTLKDVQQERRLLLATLEREFGARPSEIEMVIGDGRSSAPRSLVGAVGLALRYDLSRRRLGRRIHAVLAGVGVPERERALALALLRKEAQLEQQAVLLAPFQRLFRYWHLLHLPLTTVMFVIVAVHVFVALLFGYTWVF